MTAVLHAAGVCRSFGGVEALSDVELRAAAGEVVGLVGPNGSGKSTLINVVSGVDRPDAGRILLDGRPVGRAAPASLARRGVSRTYQTVRLFGDLTVLENVMAGVPRGQRPGFACSLLLPAQARARRRGWEEAAGAALERAGVGHLARRRARTLSHGDQRRVELARALASEPRLLLLDEPAGGLGEKERETVVSVIRAAAAAGTAVVLVEHNLAVVAEVAGRVVVLDAGRVLSSGRPDRVFGEEAVRIAIMGGDLEAA